MDDPRHPFVSVAIPTYGRARHLERCLGSLVRQDYPADRYEIVVADDGSTDRTARVVETIRRRAPLPAVRYARQDHRGLNAARNLALRHSSGDPVCFIDDDEDVPPAWLGAMVEGVLRHPAAGCVGGPMRLRFEGKPPRTCGREPFGESELDLGDDAVEVEHVWGGNMAVRRAAIAAVGPFREDLALLGGTETEWQDRLRAAGGRVMYVPEAWVAHVRTQAELRLPYLVWRHFQRGRGQAINGSRAGQPCSRTTTMQGLRIALRHALVDRCTVGVIDAARQVGRLMGMAEAALRGRDRGPP